MNPFKNYKKEQPVLSIQQFLKCKIVNKQTNIKSRNTGYGEYVGYTFESIRI